jgi:hypothetical protein
MNSKIPRIIGMIFLTLILLAIGWVWLTLHWSYAEGERTGYVQKLSKKGWLCKTWEGELSMVALPGAAPEKFEFSVRDEEIAKQIDAVMGKRVSLKYEQHKGLPTSCFGETDYFVTGLKVTAPQ